MSSYKQILLTLLEMLLKNLLLENDLEFFNTRNQTGLLRTMMLRTSSTGDIMVVVQFFKEDKEKRELLLDHI